jgi:hypothetical protein
MGDLSFVLAKCDPNERVARIRELRALAMLILGDRHPVTVALGEAAVTPARVNNALTNIDRCHRACGEAAFKREKARGAYEIRSTSTRRVK